MAASAVLYVGDLARMQAFYEQCFALREVDRGDGYVGLGSAPWLLTLVRSAEAKPVTGPPRRRAEVAVKLAFEVADISAMRPVIARLGGQIDPAGGEWRFRDAVHCDCLDPEGNVIQLIAPVRS